jgi:hypothetical protein
VYDALDKIRHRGGIAGSVVTRTDLTTKEAWRNFIRKERTVELAFEEHRFWDVRRWMIDPATMIDIQAQVPVWQADGTVRYEIRTIQRRVFETKMYRMPIPEQQIYTNPNLLQNPGWNYSPESAE